MTHRSNRYRYKICFCGGLILLTQKPKRIPGGYITKEGKRYIAYGTPGSLTHSFNPNRVQKKDRPDSVLASLIGKL